MILSASKHDALAGSRFGWGLVKDAELAESMNDVNKAIVYTIPEDAVLRTYNTMSSIISKCDVGDLLLLYLFPSLFESQSLINKNYTACMHWLI